MDIINLLTQKALGDKNMNTLSNLEAQYMDQYPGMDTSGGVFSDARHAAATNLMSDRLGGIPVLSDTLANIGGFAKEVPTFVSEAFGLTPLGQSWEDIKANFQSYNYPSGTSAEDIYADVFSKYNTQGLMGTNLGTKFRQDQFMNTQKQTIQDVIRQAEIEQKRKEEAAAAAAASAAAQVRANIQRYGSGDRPNTGINTPGSGKGQSPTGGDVQGTPFAQGGLINLYRYGGFI